MVDLISCFLTAHLIELDRGLGLNGFHWDEKSHRPLDAGKFRTTKFYAK